MIGSVNGSVLAQCQAITWTNNDFLAIEHLENAFGSSHETAAVLLPGFAINW